jgi:methyl-accepting chemotaxis protein
MQALNKLKHWFGPFPTMDKPATIGCLSRAYFQYHGAMSPGIRVMRRLALKHKLLIVALVWIACIGLPLSESLQYDIRTIQGLKVEHAQISELLLGYEALVAVSPQQKGDIKVRSVSQVGHDVSGGSFNVGKTSVQLRVHLQHLLGVGGQDASQATRMGAPFLLVLNDLIAASDHLELSTVGSQERAHSRGQLRCVQRANDLMALLASRSAAVTSEDSAVSNIVWEQRVQASSSIFSACVSAAAATQDGATQMHQMPSQSGVFEAASFAAQALGGMQTEAEALLKTVEEEFWIRAGLLALGVAMSTYLSVAAYLVISRGMKHLNHQLALFSSGDLSVRPQALGHDEVSDSLNTLSGSLAKLCDLMNTVTVGVGAVSQASQQVAFGNAELTRRNADASERLTSIVEGVLRYTEALNQCRVQVESVVTTVQTLRLEASKNRRQMQQLSDRMQSLQDKSEDIQHVVTLINGIAFRTNVLALNASVEASKAGPAGRGFSVVAQEVRSLAKKSADSAADIAKIIAESTEDISLGSSLVRQANGSLGCVDTHVNEIHLAVQAVATSTDAGRQESKLILDELIHINGGMEKNQRLVEQLSAASDSLSTQGIRLQQKVKQFTIA